MEKTAIYIVAFDTCFLPQEVTIGWTRCAVREYIPLPRRCFKCNMYGHGSKTCRQEKGTCVRCGEQSHGDRCGRPSRCSNCAEEHPASAKEYFYYRLEKEALTLQTRERISYSEAKKKAQTTLLSQMKAMRK